MTTWPVSPGAEQLAELTGRAGAGGLGPPNPIQATMARPVRKPSTAPVCLTRLERRENGASLGKLIFVLPEYDAKSKQP